MSELTSKNAILAKTIVDSVIAGDVDARTITAKAQVAQVYATLALAEEQQETSRATERLRQSLIEAARIIVR